MSNALQVLTAKLATTFDMGSQNSSELISILKATAFKVKTDGQDVSDAQMTALMVVANQYRLNPWTKEIYAFPDKNNGIVPVVGVDGWSRIINDHPQFDGMEFSQSDVMVTMPGANSPAPEWVECKMYRKDRTRPTIVREYIDEVYKEPYKGKYGLVSGPWQSHPKRFTRHKAMIQCARLAFGYGGIHDPEEAQQIVGTIDSETGEITQAPAPARPALEAYPADRFAANLPKWRELVQSGQKTPEAIRIQGSSKYSLSAEQLQAIADLGVQDVQPKPAPAPPPAQAQAEYTPLPADDDNADFLAGLGDD
jgi:phage recombination protein Bet